LVCSRQPGRRGGAMARQCARVVQSCQAAQDEDTGTKGRLDLSECQLVQIPDAVFHLMRETPLISCNLSGNVITKIPPKLAITFTLITELNVSNNRISMLPSELTACCNLTNINISGNSFVQLPPVLNDIPTLVNITANNNFIADVDTEALQHLPALQHLNLEENPLKKDSYDQLGKMTHCQVLLSPRQEEEWEDLSM